MKCPKCGFEQTQAQECSACGIIIAKYLARQKNPQKITRSTKKVSYRTLQAERELRDFYHSVSSMLRAGLTPLAAMESFLKEPGSIKDTSPYQRIQNALESGLPLSEGMHRTEAYFPAHHTRLIQAGENTGDPQVMFTQLHGMIDQRIRVLEQVQKQLRKPRNTLLASIFILPLPTLMADGLLAYLLESLLPLFILLGVLYLIYQSIRSLLEKTSLKRSFDENLLRSKLYSDYHQNRFLRVFTKLYAAGVTPADAWGIGAATTDNSFLQEVLNSHQYLLEEGKTIAETARATNAFSASALQVINTAEAAGALDSAIDRYLAVADEEFEINLDKFASRMMILIGIIVSSYVAYRIISDFTALIPAPPV